MATHLTFMVEYIDIFDLMELEIRQAASDFCNTFSAFSLSAMLAMVTVGSCSISVIRYLPSIRSSLPFDLQLKFENSNLKFSAMARKVVIRQLLTAAVNRCSGDHIPGIPFGNSGGVATSMQLLESTFNSGEHINPLRS